MALARVPIMQDDQISAHFENTLTVPLLSPADTDPVAQQCLFGHIAAILKVLARPRQDCLRG